LPSSGLRQGEPFDDRGCLAAAPLLLATQDEPSVREGGRVGRSDLGLRRSGDRVARRKLAERPLERGKRIGGQRRGTVGGDPRLAAHRVVSTSGSTSAPAERATTRRRSNE